MNLLEYDIANAKSVLLFYERVNTACFFNYFNMPTSVITYKEDL